MRFFLLLHSCFDRVDNNVIYIYIYIVSTPIINHILRDEPFNIGIPTRII